MASGFCFEAEDSWRRRRQCQTGAERRLGRQAGSEGGETARPGQSGVRWRQAAASRRRKGGELRFDGGTAGGDVSRTTVGASQDF